jgi:hypothetical protein
VTRLYLPAVLADLATLEAAGRLALPGGAVGAADDTEDAEYDALVAAAESSAALVAGLGAGLRRRVVLVVEVAGSPAEIALSDVVAVHADPADDTDPDDDLGWYATQEIADLLR